MILQQTEGGKTKLTATVSFKVTPADKALISDLIRMMCTTKSEFFRRKANRILSSINIEK